MHSSASSAPHPSFSFHHLAIFPPPLSILTTTWSFPLLVPTSCFLAIFAPSSTHPSLWSLEAAYVLRNSAPLSVDVIITQHLVLRWNTDEQQERGNEGTIKRKKKDVHSGGLCVWTRIKDEEDASIYPPAPFVTRRLSHSRRSWSANQARSKTSPHVGKTPNLFHMHNTRYN